MDPFLEEEQQSQNRFDPLAIVRIFWRRKWLFVVPFVLCLSMAIVAIKTMTPIYESSSEIRVVHENSNSAMIQDGGNRYYRRASDRDQETYSNIWTIVTAPKFLESVVRSTRVYEGRARLPRDARVPAVLSPDEMIAVDKQTELLRRKVRVRSAGNSIYELAVRNIDPDQAYILTRVILDRFLQEERANRMAPRSTTRDFLGRQKDTYRANLQAAEDTLAAFQRGLLSEALVGNPIDANNILQAESHLERLRVQYSSTDVNEMAEHERRAKAIISTLPSINTFLRDPEIATARRDLRDLIFDQGLDLPGARASGDLGRARLSLNALVEAKIAREYARLGTMDRLGISQYVYFMVFRTAKGRAIESLAQYVAAYKNFTTRQPQQSARLSELREQVLASRELLDRLERDIIQQTMNLEASMSEIGYRIEVRVDPESPEYPVEPDKMKLAFMGLALSIALGLGLVVLSVVLDRTFTSVTEIERVLSLNVIGTLPVIQDDHFTRKRRLRLLRWITLVILILGIAAVFLLYIYPRMI